jgi:hypothetical protein
LKEFLRLNGHTEKNFAPYFVQKERSDFSQAELEDISEPEKIPTGYETPYKKVVALEPVNWKVLKMRSFVVKGMHVFNTYVNRVDFGRRPGRTKLDEYPFLEARNARESTYMGFKLI